MKPFSDLLNKSGQLGRLRTSAKLLEKLAREMRVVLPGDAAPHLVGCAIQPTAVVVFCDSSAWVAQLRYSQHSLLEVCRRILDADVPKLVFRILPADPVAGKPPSPELTEDSRRLLSQAANAVSDEELSQALRRLSSNKTDQDAE